MLGIRILAAATAYCVILLEVYSGAINGPLWWILPGALVIALLFALSIFGLNSETSSSGNGLGASTVQWTLIIGTALAMSLFANYFGRELLPEIITEAAAMVTTPQ